MFNEGFAQYLATSLYSDLRLIVNDREYNVHRLIVGYSSEYISNILQTIERCPGLYEENDASSADQQDSSSSSGEGLDLLKTIPSSSPSLTNTHTTSSIFTRSQSNQNFFKDDSTLNIQHDPSGGSSLKGKSPSSSIIINTPKTPPSSPIPIRNSNNSSSSMIGSSSGGMIANSTSSSTSPNQSWKKSSPNQSTLNLSSSAQQQRDIKRPSSSLTFSKSISMLLSKTTSKVHSKASSADNSPILYHQSAADIKALQNIKVSTQINQFNQNIQNSNSNVKNNINGVSSSPSSPNTPHSNRMINSPPTQPTKITPLKPTPMSLSSNTTNPSTTTTSSLTQSDQSTSLFKESRKDSFSSTITVPLSFIKQQFYSHQPHPNIRWDDKLVIDLEIQEENNMFDQVLNFMYRGKIDIRDDNCVDILYQANYFLIHSLKKLVCTYIVEHLTGANGLNWLRKAIDYSIDELIPKCIFVIARNFSQIIESEILKNGNRNVFSFLPIDMFVQILEHNSLSVFSEYNVYIAICSYLESNINEGEMFKPEEIETLFMKVRFPYLTYNEFQQVIHNPMVPVHLLTEGLLIRLGNFENPNSTVLQKKLNTDTRFMKRKESGRVFEYTSDNDNKGIIAYFATEQGTKEWSNPSIGEDAKIKVSCSSVEKGNPQDIFDAKPSECWTMDVPSSWFMIELLGGVTLIAKHVTLRYGKHDCLRNWLFQGSEDGIDWFTIARFTNEQHIAGTETHSWSVNSITPYKFFRVLQTGKNSNNRNFLVFAGVEFYGELLGTT